MSTLDADVADRRLRAGGPDAGGAARAAAGHRVAVYERFAELYDLPRAVYFDDEIMQVWQSLGHRRRAADDLLPVTAYDWFGADGEPILRMEHPAARPVRAGSRATPSTSRPRARARPRGAGAAHRQRSHRGWSAEALAAGRRPRRAHAAPRARAANAAASSRRRDDDRARPLRDRRRRRELVRAPGAAASRFEDQGFAERWLVVDLRPDDVEALSYIPAPCQWCDPGPAAHAHAQRPPAPPLRVHAAARASVPEDFADERARVGAAGAVVHAGRRRASCATRSTSSAAGWRETMRAGRALLAGDAAHTMPPFMGQGLCSGMRDAAEPRLAARPDPARPRRRPAARRLHDRAPAAERVDREPLDRDGARVLHARPAGRRRARRRAARRRCAAGDHAAAARRPGLLRRRTGRWPAAARCRARSASATREGRFDDLVGKRLRAARPAAPRRCRPSTRSSWSAIGAQVVALEDARGPRRPADRLARRARRRGGARPPRRLRLRRRRRRSTTSPRWSTTCAPTCHTTDEDHRPMPADPSSTRSSITSTSRPPGSRR